MKKIIAGVIGAVLLIIALFIALRPASFESQLESKLNALEGYHMVGVMEMVNGEDTKRYQLDLAWKKNEDKEYYKVSMTDSAISQEQMILKNDEGVYVLTPSLNQAFKFKGDWPNNSLKPYLYQSMLSLIENEHKVKKTKDGYFITCDVVYDNEPLLVKQEMMFDKELKPLWVKVYNSDGIEQVKIEFSEVDFKPSYETLYFDVNENLKKKTANVSASIDLPLYPVYVYDARLTNSSTTVVNNEKRHILEFSGEKSFTVVEVERTKNTEPILMQVSGELVETISSFGAYDGNALTLYNSDVEVSIYSSDLSVEEMMQVAASLHVAVMK